VDEDDNGTKRLIQVVVVMMLHQAELAHRVTGIAADMTYKHTSGDMNVYRWTAMDLAIGKSFFFPLKKKYITYTSSGRDLCIVLCNYETQTALSIVFRTFHATVEKLSGRPLRYKLFATDAARLNGWTLDMAIPQFQAFGVVMRELLQEQLKDGSIDDQLRQLMECIVELPDDADVALWFAHLCMVHCNR
jgi:hypothetical protein